MDSIPPGRRLTTQQASPFAAALPHGPLVEVFPNIFQVRGVVKLAPLLSIAHYMTIVREGADLTVISALRLSEQGEAELERLGRVRHLVKLGDFQGRDDPYYKQRYQATLWALPGARHSLRLPTDRELHESGELPVSNTRLFSFRHARRPEAALIMQTSVGGILVACDSVQHWGSFAGCSLGGALLLRALGASRSALIGLRWRRRAERRRGPSLALDFARRLDLPWRHLLSAHGAPLKDTAKEALRTSVEKLYGSHR